MIWPFNRNDSSEKILERASEPLWKVEPPRRWPDPPPPSVPVLAYEPWAAFRDEVMALLKSIDESLKGMKA